MFTAYTREEVANTSHIQIVTPERSDTAVSTSSEEVVGSFEVEDYNFNINNSTSDLHQYDLDGESLW
ncbi:MAG: hypothetical protein M3040_00870 [Bacteroidota bacterium]|nr:hypothetical protein [Bacteroidota bacterium]